MTYEFTKTMTYAEIEEDLNAAERDFLDAITDMHQIDKNFFELNNLEDDFGSYIDFTNLCAEEIIFDYAQIDLNKIKEAYIKYVNM
jgi:hypothetical protein